MACTGRVRIAPNTITPTSLTSDKSIIAVYPI
jgi:hypothetical protein